MSLVIVCQILVPHKIYLPRTTKNYIFNHTTNQNKFQVKSLERKLCDSHSNKHDEQTCTLHTLHSSIGIAGASCGDQSDEDATDCSEVLLSKYLT